MKCFRRWLFNGVAAVPLMMCLATGIIWIWSYYRSILSAPWGPPSASPQYRFDVDKGSITIDRNIGIISGGDEFQLTQVPGWNFAGLNYSGLIITAYRGAYIFPGSITTTQLSCKLYWPFALTLAMVAFLFRVRSRRRNWGIGPATGLCLRCGYDLRATPDRCPECGTIPPKQKEVISA
jgi:hypothetical protein